jgi:hypothetical protein
LAGPPHRKEANERVEKSLVAVAVISEILQISKVVAIRIVILIRGQIPNNAQL